MALDEALGNLDIGLMYSLPNTAKLAKYARSQFSGNIRNRDGDQLGSFAGLWHHSGYFL